MPRSRPTTSRRPPRSPRRQIGMQCCGRAFRSRFAAPPRTRAADAWRLSKFRSTAASPGTLPRAARTGPTPGPRASAAKPQSSAGPRRQRQSGKSAGRCHDQSRSPTRASTRCGTPAPRRPLPTAATGRSVEVGMRFTVDAAGYITGMRFYKSSANTGTHIANLWSSTGVKLATATFTSETASGWQQVNFATPMAVEAGQASTSRRIPPRSVTIRSIAILLYHAGRGQRTAARRARRRQRGQWRLQLHDWRLPHAELSGKQLLG